MVWAISGYPPGIERQGNGAVVGFTPQKLGIVPSLGVDFVALSCNNEELLNQAPTAWKSLLE